MDQPFVIFFKDQQEFWTEEGCYITENLNSSRDPGLSIAQARVKPGTTTAWHSLRDTTERYLILSGQGVVQVQGLPPTSVGPGDVVVIPPGVPQRITNTGQQDLIFLALCTPRFRRRNYQALE